MRFKDRIYSNFVFILQLSQSHCAFCAAIKIMLEVFPLNPVMSPAKGGYSITEEGCRVLVLFATCPIQKALALLQLAQSSLNLGKIPPKVHGPIYPPSYQPRPSIGHLFICFCLCLLF